MISPRPDYVILRRAETSYKIGSIYLPDSAKEVPHEGEVVSAGSDCVVKEGQTILFASFAGEEFPDPNNEGEWLILIEQKFCLAILGEV